MADQGQILTGLDMQVEIFEHRLVLLISEVDVLEFDLALQSGDRTPVDLRHLRFGVDQGEDPLGGGKPVLHLGPEG